MKSSASAPIFDEEAWKSFISLESYELAGVHRSRWTDWTACSTFPGTRPTSLLDRDGAIAFRQTGFGSDSEQAIESAINRALAKPVSAQPPPATAASPAPVPSAAALPPPLPPSAPPAHILVKFTYPPDDVQDGDVRANVYRNDFLGLTCKFPATWTSAEPETLDQSEQGGIATDSARRARPSGPRRRCRQFRQPGVPADRISSQPRFEAGRALRGNYRRADELAGARSRAQARRGTSAARRDHPRSAASGYDRQARNSFAPTPNPRERIRPSGSLRLKPSWRRSTA